MNVAFDIFLYSCIFSGGFLCGAAYFSGIAERRESERRALIAEIMERRRRLQEEAALRGMRR